MKQSSLYTMPYYKNQSFIDFLLQNKHNHLTMRLALNIFYDMARCVSVMHNADYAHLDIKLDNFLVKDDFHVIISDLESARKITIWEEPVGGGTEMYQSPEQKGSKCTNYKAADIFSLGVCLYCTVTRRMFDYGSYTKDEASFWAHAKKSGTCDPSEIDDSFIKLIQLMLRENPEDRVSIQDLLELPYLVKNLYDEDQYQVAMKEFLTK